MMIKQCLTWLLSVTKISWVLLIVACSSNVTEEPAVPEQVAEQTEITDNLPSQDTSQAVFEPIDLSLWAVGDEWFQRNYMVAILQELANNDAMLSSITTAAKARPLHAPLPLYEGQNNRVLLNGLDNPQLLTDYLGAFDNFVAQATTRPRDLKPVYGYNHQFLLLMSAKQWQTNLDSTTQGVSTKANFAPNLLLQKLRQSIDEYSEFTYGLQVIYDYQQQMLGIFGATEGENINYLQALLLDELHKSKQASVLDIPLPLPPWLAKGLKNNNDRVLRFEYVPKS